MSKKSESKGMQLILDGTFDAMVKHGLENIHIRDLCREIGCAQGSIYYWFGNKEQLLLSATEHGLKKVSDGIFDYVFKSITNLEKFFGNVLDVIWAYKEPLRCIYQMTASPVYGKVLRANSQKFTEVYDDYAYRLSEQFKCNADDIKPLVYMFAATVIDFAIWESKNETKIQLDFIYKCLCNCIEGSQKNETVRSVMFSKP